MTEAEAKADLNRIHLMQVECYTCINNRLMSHEVIEKARKIQLKLGARETAIEEKLREITTAERLMRLEEIERELASYEGI